MKVNDLVGVLEDSCSVCYKGNCTNGVNIMCNFMDTPWNLLEKSLEKMYIGQDDFEYGVIYIEVQD